MVIKKLIFRVDDLEVNFEKKYNAEPNHQQVIEDIKEWFFEEYYMWFAVEEDGEETNLEDYF